MIKICLAFLVCGVLYADGIDDKTIELLGNPEWRVREDAHSKIFHIGGPALHLLSSHRSHNNPEVRWRVNTLIDTIVAKTPVRFFMDKEYKCFFNRKRAQIIADISDNPHDNFPNYFNDITMISNFDIELCGYICFDIWQLKISFQDKPFLYEHIANAAVYMYERYNIFYNPYEELLIEHMIANYDETNLTLAAGRIKSLRMFQTLLYYYVTRVEKSKNVYSFSWRGIFTSIEPKILKSAYKNVLNLYPKSFVKLVKPIVLFMPEYDAILQELDR